MNTKIDPNTHALIAAIYDASQEIVESLSDALGCKMTFKKSATEAADELLKELTYELETPADHIPDVGNMVEPEKVLKVRIKPVKRSEAFVSRWYNRISGETLTVKRVDGGYEVVGNPYCQNFIPERAAEIIPEEVPNPTFTPLVITAETKPTHRIGTRYGIPVVTAVGDKSLCMVCEDGEWFEDWKSENNIRKLTPSELAKWREDNR